MADNDKDKSVKVEAPKEKDERRKIHMYIKVGFLSSSDCDRLREKPIQCYRQSSDWLYV